MITEIALGTLATIITEIALSTLAAGVIAGTGYALVKSFSTDTCKPARLQMRKKGVLLTRLLLTAQYVLITVTAVTLIPIGLLMGFISFSDLQETRGVRSVK